MKKASNSKVIEEIRIFIEYSVTEDERDIAFETLENYDENIIALQVMRDFYSRLPEFRQEAVCKITRIVSRHDVFLLGVDTSKHEYLYFYNEEEPYYIGEKKDGIGEDEVLSFFGYSSNEDFLNKADDSGELESDMTAGPNVFCPACAVAEGEYHHLGCPVEICPWCDGQLTYCNCRFEQLGVDEIVEESEIDRLEVLLYDKGRIPFASGHAPAYPTGGDDDDE